ncbi:histidinol-phosphatase [Lactobacillus sp. CBA3606]|uniref:histidinol-phosphatase HisJ n=1 Tax=Lactobacillus sp. CBA3606 TaxID=2099789 RepID=UPI000CFBB7FB|nr:histidinol-phosphatase HisJ [Lactobacillus sp. CBA3606]AVK63480.1 histidinol-phosphatase [Lactobacillus sp. CBA3606]
MLMDGHTHTELCPHGSGEATEKMIQRAIQLGMQKYCITEHAPLPPDFKQQYAGQLTGFTTASLPLALVPDYLKLARALQKKYASQLAISVGFEVDFLPDQVAWTRAFLNEYGPQTQENILSVHFMRGTDQKFWCLDDTLTDFETGFEAWLNQPQVLFNQYYQTVLASVVADLGPTAPQRIGHMSLIRKFQDRFNLTAPLDATNLALVDEILDQIKWQNREIDLNLAGLFKPFCNDFYPGHQILERAKKRGIPLIYGSDAHDIQSVGHGQHLAIALING